MDNNSENSKEFHRKVEEIQKSTTVQSLSEIIAEGNILLQKDTKIKSFDSPIDLQSKLAENNLNPYIKARFECLKKLPNWKRHEILNMEKLKDINNRFYEDFVKEVRILGDSLQN